jgi:hypothetical protein
MNPVNCGRACSQAALETEYSEIFVAIKKGVDRFSNEHFVTLANRRGVASGGDQMTAHASSLA